MRSGRATKIESHSRRKQAVPTYMPRRVCESPACSTVLSIYNSGAHCSLHEPLGHYGRNDVLREQRGAAFR